MRPTSAALRRIASRASILAAVVASPAFAQQGWETWVVSGSPEALELARGRGGRAVAERGSSLGEAVRQAETEFDHDAGAVEAGELAVVLADLPTITAEALSQALARPGAVVAAPATRGSPVRFSAP